MKACAACGRRFDLRADGAAAVGFGGELICTGCLAWAREIALRAYRAALS